jgi:uroporphyrinogen-III synthase
MNALKGRRIALLERRHGGEFAALVEQLGGVAVSAPAIEEVVSHDDYHAFLDGLVGRRFSLAIFLNGVGLDTLLTEATRRGRLQDALHALRGTTIACRGGKPLAALKQYGLKASITTARPHTTGELLDALACVDVADRGVVLVHSGERNTAVVEELKSRGARLVEVYPYERMLPDDRGPIARVVRDVIAHRIDAVLFTNRNQCHHLFAVAREMSQTEGLALSLNRHVVVGAVGPVCARALERAGVTPDVVPASPNMPSLVQAVARYFDQRAI